MLFKFVTEIPSPIKTWEAIAAAHIPPAEGYARERLQFLFFYILRTSNPQDFTKIKHDINEAITSKNYNKLFAKYLNTTITTSVIHSLPMHLGNVPKELYTAYISYAYGYGIRYDTEIETIDAKEFEDLFGVPPTIKEIDYVYNSSSKAPTVLTTLKQWRFSINYADFINENYTTCCVMDMRVDPIYMRIKEDLFNYIHSRAVEHLQECEYISETYPIYIPSIKIADATEASNAS